MKLQFFFVYRAGYYRGPDGQHYQQVDLVGAIGAPTYVAAVRQMGKQFSCRPQESLFLIPARPGQCREAAKLEVARMREQMDFRDWLSSPAYEPPTERRPA